MNDIIGILLVQVPWFAEVGYDSLFWYVFKKSDKPHSTWIFRPIMMIGISVWVVLGCDKAWWQVVFLILFSHALFFPLVINWVRGMPWYYVSNTKNKWSYDYWVRKVFKDRNLPRLWLRIFLFAVGLCLFYYFELLYEFK